MPALQHANSRMKQRPSRASRAIATASTAAGHVTRGDVLDDLGFSPKKAASVKLKADLHDKIIKQALGFYSQQELQAILHESQSRVSNLMRGKIAGFTLDMLVFYAERLGIQTAIMTKVLKRPARPQLPAVVAGRVRA